MANITEVKETIKKLPDEDFNAFADWFEKLEEKRWDKELGKDIAEGKLDDLANEAINEYKTGKCTKL